MYMVMVMIQLGEELMIKEKKEILLNIFLKQAKEVWTNVRGRFGLGGCKDSLCTDAGSWVDTIGELGHFSDYVSFLSETGSKVITVNRECERTLDILRNQERHERHPESGRRNWLGVEWLPYTPRKPLSLWAYRVTSQHRSIFYSCIFIRTHRLFMD